MPMVALPWQWMGGRRPARLRPCRVCQVPVPVASHQNALHLCARHTALHRRARNRRLDRARVARWDAAARRPVR